MFTTAPARSIDPHRIRQIVTGAGVGPLDVAESTGEYDYLGTADGTVGITWYQRVKKTESPALVFELDVNGYGVSDAADSEQELLDLLGQAITAEVTAL